MWYARPADRLNAVSTVKEMAVNPTGSEIAQFLANDSGAPVVMLNLLRFKPGGRQSYQQYSREFAARIGPRYGVKVLYAGEGSTALVADPGQAWDAVLLVQYPSRAAFSAMIADPDYQHITPLRTAALEEAVLQATSPW